MRELRFRAWDKEKSRWVREYDYQLEDREDPAYEKEYGEDSGWLDGEVASDLDLVNDRLAIDRYVWEQYTGLKDKNGKEIYEGDIVKATVRISTPYKGDTFRNIRGNVIYGPGGAFCIEEPEVFTSNDEGSKREFTVINPLFNVGSKVGVEVIGNIHEGKESDGEEENKTENTQL